MSKIQHSILLFKSGNCLPWMNIFRFNKCLKGLQSWSRVSTDDVTSLFPFYPSLHVKSSTPLSSMSLPTLETLHWLHLSSYIEMSTFVLIFRLRCCSSVHLISVKAPLLCPVFFPLCPICSLYPQPFFYCAFDSSTAQCSNHSLLPVGQALCLYIHIFHFTSYFLL